MNHFNISDMEVKNSPTFNMERLESLTRAAVDAKAAILHTTGAATTLVSDASGLLAQLDRSLELLALHRVVLNLNPTQAEITIELAEPPSENDLAEDISSWAQTEREVSNIVEQARKWLAREQDGK